MNYVTAQFLDIVKFIECKFLINQNTIKLAFYNIVLDSTNSDSFMLINYSFVTHGVI